MSRHQKQSPIETRIITGIGRGIWSLLSLPFKKRKSGRAVEQWKEVQQLMAKEDSHAWAMAIMKADNILDSALQKRVSGETMGERLKNMENRLSRIALQSAWDGHKIRNLVAHGESNISKTQAQEAIASIRTALNSLNEL